MFKTLVCRLLIISLYLLKQEYDPSLLTQNCCGVQTSCSKHSLRSTQPLSSPKYIHPSLQSVQPKKCINKHLDDSKYDNIILNITNEGKNSSYLGRYTK